MDTLTLVPHQALNVLLTQQNTPLRGFVAAYKHEEAFRQEFLADYSRYTTVILAGGQPH